MPPKETKNEASAKGQRHQRNSSPSASAAQGNNDSGARKKESGRNNDTNTDQQKSRPRKNNNPKKKKQMNRREGRQNNSLGNNNNNNNDSSQATTPFYPPHVDSATCMTRYASNDPNLIRGKLRVLPATDAVSFVTCDRGSQAVDICIPGALERNRAMDGDKVFVELIDDDDDDDKDEDEKEQGQDGDVVVVEPIDEEEDEKEQGQDNNLVQERLEKLQLNDDDDDDISEDDEAGDAIVGDWNNQKNDGETWQDDPVQMSLWNPLVAGIRRKSSLRSFTSTTNKENSRAKQRKGRVIHIIPPQSMIQSELDRQAQRLQRRIVGSLKVLQSGTTLLTPNNKSLPQFKCPASSAQRLLQQCENPEQTLFQATYQYDSWKQNHKWPPCCNVQVMGQSCVLEDEIQALLTEFNVDHGEDFSPPVLKDVDEAVNSGLYYLENENNNNNEMGWKPTQDMYKGRRDYRSERIFTIDPTTAKDLDDALHIKLLEDGRRVEIGVHIADVSFFVRPDSAVDEEARRRATTVYLVDRTIPMLPRPLCEVACSLNENVERLAFSCVWRMNLDGTLRTKDGQIREDDVWYGRTVIKSCARLDYAAAQNIIEGKVANGESEEEMDEELWPKNRRPTGGHTVDQVAADVRLMHRIAMARRKLRFDNGALALNGIKLTFRLDADGKTPLLAAPYPIRDSNRLVEEYMLLANYLVAQRLITHARELAVLRYHPEPLMTGLDQVVTLAKVAADFDVDITSSRTLHESLVRFEHECDSLLLQCVTNLMMTPMQPAEYFVAGLVEPEEWRHFALNIPYYTHFTSPIRRYADVLVHRLLQATIDGKRAVENFSVDEQSLKQMCDNCNEKRMGSKNAQERCDRVFLSLYVRSYPMKSQLGVVLSVGISTFNVYIPSLGTSAMLFLQEHTNILTFAAEEEEDGTRRILLQQKADCKGARWNTLEIKVFVKLSVTITCKDNPPIDIKLRLEGPWTD